LCFRQEAIMLPSLAGCPFKDLRVAIVGAGAAEVLAALAVRDRFPDADLMLFDPSNNGPRGIAYSFPQAWLRPNIPASNMGGPVEGDLTGLVDWVLRRHGLRSAEYVTPYVNGDYRANRSELWRSVGSRREVSGLRHRKIGGSGPPDRFYEHKGESLVKTIANRFLASDARGQGETIVFVHGLGSTSSVWEAQVRHLAKNFRTLRYDLDGAGRSPPSGSLSIQGWVADLVAILDAFEVKRAKFVGHSLGTLILQHFAVQHPDRVSGICLLGTNRSPSEQRRKALADRMAKVRSEGLEAIVDNVVEGTLSPTSLQEKPELAGYVRELLLCQSVGGYLASCEAVLQATAADITKIACPVLAIHGRDDTVSPPSVAEAIVAEAECGEMRGIEACGHWHPIEQAAAVNVTLDHFVTLRGRE
jgi:3-oxoadipate enol-lactonase